MDQAAKKFAQRYRVWIDSCELQNEQAEAVWKRIFRALELSQGPPQRSGPPGIHFLAFECCTRLRQSVTPIEHGGFIPTHNSMGMF